MDIGLWIDRSINQAINQSVNQSIKINHLYKNSVRTFSQYNSSSFISAGGQRVITGGRAKLFELNFFEKLSTRWSNRPGKIVLTASRFAWCQALNETPAVVYMHQSKYKYYMKRSGYP